MSVGKWRIKTCGRTVPSKSMYFVKFSPSLRKTLCRTRPTMPRQENSFFQTWKIKLLRNAPRELLAPKQLQLEFENELGALQGESILIKVILREPLPSCGRGLSALAGEQKSNPAKAPRSSGPGSSSGASGPAGVPPGVFAQPWGPLSPRPLASPHAAAGFSGQSGKATLAAP